MDSQTKFNRSLPPLVEGKVHGSLRLVISEVLWIRTNPGDVTVVASWWGEHDNAKFRPKDSTTETERTNEDVTEVYAIKTNATLFADYIKNCNAIEIVIFAENIYEIIGRGYIGELSKIFSCKYYSQCIPILSNDGHKIGKLHVSLQLTYLTKLFHYSNIQMRTCKYDREEDKDILLFPIDNLQYNRKMKSYNDAENTKEKKFKKGEIDTYDMYRSVFKTSQSEFEEKKSNEMVTDKLVDQIVARAQYLREVILKETYKEDSSTLNDSSSSNELHFNTSSENKEKLDKYILGMEMSSLEEKKVLNMLRSTPPCLIDLMPNIIATDKDNINTGWNQSFSIKLDSPEEDILDKNMTYDVPLSLTYFIQYDTTFGSTKQANKSSKETKFTRTYAKKQVGQVVNFNSEGIYSISRHNINKNFPLRFKVFVKHHNQKFPTGLGFGFININDITNTTNLSSTQCIVIVNKGIKIGDLKVTIELGCDFIHFGKEFVDAVISKKENLPILNKKALTSPNDNKYKSATGTHSSKSNCEVSSVSAKQIKCLTSNNNKDMVITKDMTEHREQNLDNKKIDTSNPESGIKDKILLHGLIYVAEGKDLPESNTYLICRAFWREDKASSQICNNTKNPFYHFFQLVPLLHGIELLERIKDNYIIIEVYNRQNSGIDNLLGIAKLPVHQLYIAYRDPLVFPHLLLLKYPVISVDGWVNINDPVNGKFCGKLLALVALGTAEQIALLEVSRGLRNTNNISRTDYSYHYLASVDYKSQESQTDISSLKNARPQKPIQEAVSSEHLALRALVDRLTNVLHTNKISTNQSVQTDINQVNEGKIHTELCLNTLNSNSLTDDCNPNNDFRLPMEVYRSVGVGAEYEDLDQQQNNANNFSNSSLTEENVQKLESNINCNSSFFRSMIEIECALHLPKIEGLNELMEPSTYVTFQDLTHKFNSTNQLNSYMVTNVCPYSCNPKWNWKCDVKLSTELLLNNQKRLILKVWHLIDPNTSKDINLRRDSVIGFSAIDLSILITGFPTVSGWFHIMDFTGKCNGQIKISVTPLDNLSSLGKFAPTNSTNLSRCSNSLQTNWPSLYNVPCTNAELNGAHQIPYENQNNNKYVQNDCKLNTHIGHNLEDVSISFLSSSLKQKLTELDEITKRLQSRLHDVTNTAFEDEFDNDFDMIELNIDNENTNDRNVKITHYPQSTVSEYFNTGTSQMSKQCGIQSDRNVVNDEKQTSSTLSSNCNLRFDSASNKSRAISFEVTALGCCSSSNTHFSQHSGYYHNQYQNRYSSTYNYLLDNNTEYPVRGTKAHINHLLDKLSLDLPPKSSSETAIPIRKNILELLTNLREHKNNSQDKDKNNYDINTCTVLTQTDNEQNASSSTANFLTSKTTIEENISVEMPHNRISTVIREELVAEENNDSAICDELTTYLITSNVRHMNLDSIFNPLLYQHLVPDLQITATVSPEAEVVEQLDNRYIKNFTVHSDIDLLKENNVFQNDIEMKDRITVLECDKKKEFFGLTPSDISENIDNNIDMTVIYESSENDLTSDNNTESTAIMSFDKSSIQQTEIEIKNYSIVSELSVTGISRQAPEGGNPTEEVKTLLGAKQQNYIQDISADN
ncbi:C2CD3 protein, partial [Pseudoatta argentina]